MTERVSLWSSVQIPNSYIKSCCTTVACNDTWLEDGQTHGQKYLMGKTGSISVLFMVLFQLSKWVVQIQRIASSARLLSLYHGTQATTGPHGPCLSPGAGWLSPLSPAPRWCSELWKICLQEGKMRKEVGVPLMSLGIEISPVQVISFRVEEKKATVESP